MKPTLQLGLRLPSRKKFYSGICQFIILALRSNSLSFSVENISLGCVAMGESRLGNLMAASFIISENLKRRACSSRWNWSKFTVSVLVSHRDCFAMIHRKTTSFPFNLTYPLNTAMILLKKQRIIAF